MSESNGTQDRVKIEEDSKLYGLMAVLALPPRRMPNGLWRRVTVEVEVVAGAWVQVDTVIVEAETITVCRNGLDCWRFLRAEGVPNWRTPDISNAPREWSGP
jgi:hypothetical protein